MQIQCLLHLTWLELHAVIGLSTGGWSIMTHSSRSYKILSSTSWCKWKLMIHSLAILTLMTTGINSITPESSSEVYHSSSMLTLAFVNPNPPSSLTLTAYILWFSRLQTAESEVLHTALPNRPLTVLLNPKTTEDHQNRVSFWLVYRIWRVIFIHYPQQTQFEPTYVQLLPLTKIPTLSSAQVLQQWSTHRQCLTTRWPLHSYARTRVRMNYLLRSQMHGR